MLIRYACKIRLISHPENFKETLRKILDNLTYKPFSVYCFYNEFKRPPDKEIIYNKEFLVDNVSVTEMKGITSMSIYDSDYRPDATTPFVRLRFDVTEKIENSTITIEWVYFENFDFLLKNDQIINDYVSKDNRLIFCYLYNQLDTYEQSNSKESWLKKNWGKVVLRGGMQFQAAPIMYFGKDFESIISLDKLKVFGERIGQDEIIKIELDSLYLNPEGYRKKQKRFWKQLNLEKVIADYESKTKINLKEMLKRRAELARKK
jgi:hypothetical protein